MESTPMIDISHLIGLLLLAQPVSDPLPFELDEEDLLPEIPDWPSIYREQVCESDPQLCAPLCCPADLSHM